MKTAAKPNLQEERLKKLGNRYWRLNNLYWILTEQGERIKFKLNAVQEILYFALWWLNIIPKSRQHGITTFIAIFMLDTCLFNSNMRCGIIAHKLQDAKKIFRDKVKYAYDSLPEDLKAERFLVKDDAMELLLSNNSGIYIGTSMRSGTLQILHISEYGWICTHMPIKAAEIKAGAMETVHEGGMIFIESTFEGPRGDFPEMCKTAEDLRQTGKELGKMDYRIHFFNWLQKASNITDPDYVKIDDKQHKYFDKLERIYDVKVSMPQRAWYVAKKKQLKHLMYKEHPSTFEEASIASIEGAYYAAEISQMREEGRICRVDHFKDELVHTVCDIGLGPNMPWIFFQVCGQEVHIVNYFCLSKKDDSRGGAAYYRRMLDEYKDDFGYNYGRYFGPFDMNKGEIGEAETIYETFKRLGIDFYQLEEEKFVLDGIERLTNLFPRLWIDAEKCGELIAAWSSYHREWIPGLNRFHETPHPDASAHPADAGRYLSKVIEDGLYKVTDSITLAKWRRLKAEHD